MLCAQTFMNPNLFDLLKENSLFENLPKPLRELLNNTMVAPEESMDTISMTIKEAVQAITVREAPKITRLDAEIPNLPCTPRPKKDK